VRATSDSEESASSEAISDAPSLRKVCKTTNVKLFSTEFEERVKKLKRAAAIFENDIEAARSRAKKRKLYWADIDRANAWLRRQRKQRRLERKRQRREAREEMKEFYAQEERLKPGREQRKAQSHSQVPKRLQSRLLDMPLRFYDPQTLRNGQIICNPYYIEARTIKGKCVLIANDTAYYRHRGEWFTWQEYWERDFFNNGYGLTEPSFRNSPSPSPENDHDDSY